MELNFHPVPFNLKVGALLEANQLPTSDLEAESDVRLFGYAPNGELAGVVGLELYGTSALLRSLAVAESGRGDGLGAALVVHAEHHAAQQGVRSVYLLTTTASKFFERHGYRHAKREDAPPSIAGTSQFSNLCPASSAFMVKAVRS